MNRALLFPFLALAGCAALHRAKPPATGPGPVAPAQGTVPGSLAAPAKMPEAAENGESSPAPRDAAKTRYVADPAAQIPAPNYLLSLGHHTDAHDVYNVNAGSAPVFVTSPVQKKPDFSLRKGDTVTMVDRSADFSKVRTRSGREGYVATSLLTPLVPLPPEPTAPAFEPTDAAPFTAIPGLRILPVDQMLNEGPLPTNAAPSPTSKPSPSAKP